MATPTAAADPTHSPMSAERPMRLRSNGVTPRARAARTTRASHARPLRRSSVSPSDALSTDASVRARNTVATSATAAPPVAISPTTRSRRPSPQQTRTNAQLPSTRANPAYVRARQAIRPADPDELVVLGGTTVDGSIGVALPTVNVNAPATGCPSADTTCQSTTYAPSGTSGTVAVTTEPSAAGLPRSIRSPFASSSTTASSSNSTRSEKCSVIRGGGSARWAPAAGTLSRSSAWPNTVPAGAAATSSDPPAMARQRPSRLTSRTTSSTEDEPTDGGDQRQTADDEGDDGERRAIAVVGLTLGVGRVRRTLVP